MGLHGGFEMLAKDSILELYKARDSTANGLI